jgi:serine/threonine protein kinase
VSYSNCQPLQPAQKLYVYSCPSPCPKTLTDPFEVPIDDFEQIKTRLQEADNRFREHEKQWEERMAIAQAEQEDEIRRRAESMSSASTSVPNGLNGDKMYPSGTHMSYEYVHHLGEGTHGQVAAVRSVNNGELYAMKTIRCINEVHAREKKIEVAREVEAMRSLRHHHIVSVTDWTMDPVHHVFNILVSPVGEGHLGDYLSSNDRNRFNFGKQYDRWFGCLITALHHAHVKLIIHQDIKPSNIIIKQHEPYLADFGTAKDFRLADNSKSSEELIKGTPNYLAPEDQPGVERGRATDVFSLGCVFAEMLTVRQERDIEEFRTWRRKSDSEYPFAFRDNLSKVREWLLDLKCVGNAGFFREQTLSMIQETGAARPVTHSLRRLFRGEDLVCDSCS